MSNKQVHKEYSGLNNRASSLSSLQPVDDSPFKQHSSTAFIWASVILVWMVSLLPWRMWAPAPDILLVCILFWCLHETHRISLLTAFIFGILMDVHDTGLMGAQALSYILAAYGVLALSRRMLRFSVVIQAFHIIPILIASFGVSAILQSWLLGEWLGWSWLWSALLTAALWPFADLILLLPQRRRAEADASGG